MPCGQLFQFNAPDTGNRILLDDQLVAVGCGSAHVGLGVELVPGAQPACHGVFVSRSADGQTVGLLQCPLEFFLDLRLGFAQHVFDKPFPGLWVIPGGVPALPPAILPLADIAFSVGPFLCHIERLLCSNTTYHTYSWIAISKAQSYQTVINLPGRKSLCQRRIIFCLGRKSFSLFLPVQQTAATTSPANSPRKCPNIP